MTIFAQSPCSLRSRIKSRISQLVARFLRRVETLMRLAFMPISEGWRCWIVIAGVEEALSQCMLNVLGSISWKLHSDELCRRSGNSQRRLNGMEWGGLTPLFKMNYLGELHKSAPGMWSKKQEVKCMIPNHIRKYVIGNSQHRLCFKERWDRIEWS